MKSPRLMTLMEHGLLLLLLVAAVTHLGDVPAISDAFDPLKFQCSSTSNYSFGSAYQSNLNIVLSSLNSIASFTGFSTATAGQGSDQVYGLFLCRGDIPLDTCRNCTNVAKAQIMDVCPSSKSAILWRELCQIRYSDQNFIHTEDHEYYRFLCDVNDASNTTPFNQLLWSLMGNLSFLATKDSSQLMFARGETKFTSNQTIYGMVQCTRDISLAECLTCLRFTMNRVTQRCADKKGTVILSVSCSIRFEVYPFLLDSAALQPQLPPPPLPSLPRAYSTTRTRRKKKPIDRITVYVVIIVVAGLLFCIFVMPWVATKCMRPPHETPELPNEGETMIATDMEVEDEGVRGMEAVVYDLCKIKAATNNFSPENKLGEGGYGPVYKGKLEDGTEVTVKRWSGKSSQGGSEFTNEVRLIAKLQHKNLVRLLGSCVDEEEKILVYEYVPNKSLDCILFGPNRSEQLQWETRAKIISGIAKGLLYLHEDSRLKIIHGDLKAANILLDEDMNPKISDFGFVELFRVDQSDYLTSRPARTLGYMSPECSYSGQYSEKSDVFSFGVLVLEIVCGQKNSSFKQSEVADNLLANAWRLHQAKREEELIDKALGESCPKDAALRCIHIGLLCVQENTNARPCMSNVVLMLATPSLALPPPSPPPFFNLGLPASDQPNMGTLIPSSTNDVIAVTKLEGR